MRVLFAAGALAAALSVVPIEARLEPLTSAVATPSTKASPPSETQSTDGLHNPGIDVKPASDVPNANAASVPPAVITTSADAICAALDQSAAESSLPLDFFTRLIWQESRFNPFSVSHAGAQGIAQFMPGTARLVGLVNPFDPIQALIKSAALLRDLRAQFGNLGLAAAAYNAGSKRIEDWLANRKPLPQETQAYVRIITGRSAWEWTSPDAGNWESAPAAPGPCEQLAKPVPHRTQPVIAMHQPERPARVIVVAQKSDRTAHQSERTAHQPDRTTSHQPDRALANIPANGSGKGAMHAEARVTAHAEPKATAHAEPKVANRETIRCCRAPASGVKLAHLEAERTTSKSVIPPVKSTIPAPKSIIAAPKGETRAHPSGSAAAHGAPAEASHAPKREQAIPAHRKPAPNSRTAAHMA